MSIEDTTRPAVDGAKATPDAAAPTPRTLRRAGVWTLVAAFAVALTPITVFIVPWGAIAPEMASGSSPLWRDPVATSQFGWLGVIYALQGVLFAVAVVAAALLLARHGTALGRLQLGAAFGAGLLTLVSAGTQSTLYSPVLAGFGGELATLQPHVAIREMVGISVLMLMQGIAGATGLAVMTWMLAVAVDLRRVRVTGTALIVVLGVFAAVMVLLFHSGVAAGAEVVSLFPLALTGFWLLAAARRRAR